MAAINIYVGNLPYRTTEADLTEIFGAYGPVVKATVVTDRETGRSKGFGFVEMADYEEGREAISKLGGQPFNGRPMTVNEARPRGSGTGNRVLGDGSGGTTKPTGESHFEEEVETFPRLAPRQERIHAFGHSSGYSNTLLRR